MLKSLFKIGFLFFAFGFGSVLTSEAQTKSCNLQFKIFAYKTNSLPKVSLEGVESSIKNLKSKEKQSLNITSTTSGFENLAEGTYRIELVKKGFKEKKKDIKLDCNIADNDNIVWEYVYLWRDKSTFDNIENLQKTVAKTENSAETDSNPQIAEVSQSNNSTDKSNTDKPKVYGKVTVQILIDEDGNVVSAKAIDGNPLLRDSAVKSARQSKFAPTIIADYPVKVTGNIVYNFVP